MLPTEIQTCKITGQYLRGTSLVPPEITDA